MIIIIHRTLGTNSIPPTLYKIKNLILNYVANKRNVKQEGGGEGRVGKEISTALL